MKKATLLLSNIKLNPSQINKFRGFVGNLFEKTDLFHNHDIRSGRPIYRYPLIQYKLIGSTPAVIAITESAVSAFMDLFMRLEEINIDGAFIPLHEKDLKIEDAVFGYTTDLILYEFYSPWIGLNQHNFRRYENACGDNRETILKSTLIGNILSLSKGIGIWLEKDQHVAAHLEVSGHPVSLKGRRMAGFKGRFRANFIIPDYLGLGKSVSRGFGTVRRAR